ncbi:MAG: SIS domain-containing protein [Chloroflexi bacterium]|nr:SIS domain-containing protein [Anaerolineaceae bacterium]NMB88821.1 SIS domain-containing protein [Chloroflexota bacterium]
MVLGIDYVQSYLNDLSQIIEALPKDTVVEIGNLLQEAREADKHIFIMGNGGSAATASHIAGDFIKNSRNPGQKRVSIFALNDNAPAVLSLSNDESYEVVYSEQLRSHARPGDLVIAISGSGNSPNVVNAVDAAKEMGLKTIGLTGFKGGKLKEKTDLCLVVPSDNMEMIEDAHMMVGHILTDMMRGAAWGK